MNDPATIARYLSREEVVALGAVPDDGESPETTDLRTDEPETENANDRTVDDSAEVHFAGFLENSPGCPADDAGPGYTPLPERQ